MSTKKEGQDYFYSLSEKEKNEYSFIENCLSDYKAGDITLHHAVKEIYDRFNDELTPDFIFGQGFTGFGSNLVDDMFCLMFKKDHIIVYLYRSEKKIRITNTNLETLFLGHCTKNDFKTILNLIS